MCQSTYVPHPVLKTVFIWTYIALLYNIIFINKRQDKNYFIEISETVDIVKIVLFGVTIVTESSRELLKIKSYWRPQFIF